MFIVVNEKNGKVKNIFILVNFVDLKMQMRLYIIINALYNRHAIRRTAAARDQQHCMLRMALRVAGVVFFSRRATNEVSSLLGRSMVMMNKTKRKGHRFDFENWIACLLYKLREKSDYKSIIRL